MRALTRPNTRPVLTFAIVALALAGGALATVAVEDIAHGMGTGVQATDFETIPDPDERRREMLYHLGAVAITTPLLLALALVIGVMRPGWVGVRTFLACGALGWLNCPVSLGLSVLVYSGDLGSALSSAVLGAIFGVFFATPFGLLYGGVSALATRRLRRLIDRPTLSAKVDALATVAATVCGAASFATLIAAMRRAPFIPWPAPAALALASGLVLVFALLYARWIRGLVRDPARARLERVALDELGVDSVSLLPLHAGVSTEASHALVRAVEAGEGAYRGVRARHAVALVD